MRQLQITQHKRLKLKPFEASFVLARQAKWSEATFCLSGMKRNDFMKNRTGSLPLSF